MIRVRMHDESHALVNSSRDVFQNVWLGIDEQAEAMPAHPCIFAGRVLAETMRAEDIILRTRNFGCRRAIAHHRDTGFQGRPPQRMRLELLRSRRPDHKGAAYL